MAGARRRFWFRIIAGLTLIALFLSALGAIGSWYYFGLRRVSASGGLYFINRYELPVRHFCQADPRWAEEPLGPTSSSLGAEGCAVTSAAMVLAYYGVEVDPDRLNQFLTAHEGYTPQGWLYWEKAAAVQPKPVAHYEDLPSYHLIDENLLRRNPVIVRVRLASGVTHFVVISGKQGFDYLIQDPAQPDERTAYPLKELVSEVDALRFYEPIGAR
ncbi:MAG: C39 family peptidase [Verrucomicrobia bacterium]|nr:C39 family peptidase [Verrucomicrobiota bacterium]